LLNSNGSPVLFRCTACNFEEFIPKDIVDYFDIMDGGDPTFPPALIASAVQAKCSPFIMSIMTALFTNYNLFVLLFLSFVRQLLFAPFPQIPFRSCFYAVS